MNSCEILILVKVLEIFNILIPSEYGFLENNVQWGRLLMFHSLRFSLVWFSVSIRIFNASKIVFYYFI
jgi:hypothetical protein